MKHVLSAVAGVLLTVMIVLGTMFGANASSGEEPQGCVISIAGVKVCGTLLNQPLPEVVTVTVPPPNLPTVTVTLPGETTTVNPGAPLTVTKTPEPVRVTETVTAPPLPQATMTVTENADGTPNSTSSASPQATVTKTVRPNGKPVPTVTETVTPEPTTGQDESGSGTVEPNNDEGFFSPEIDFGDETVTAGEAGVGLLGALLIFALILGGMYYGFRRGMATENREEAYFLREMLQK